MSTSSRNQLALAWCGPIGIVVVLVGWGRPRVLAGVLQNRSAGLGRAVHLLDPVGVFVAWFFVMFWAVRHALRASAVPAELLAYAGEVH